MKKITTLLNGFEKRKLLWTNPNPTAAFSAQTVSLDLSKYDAIEVSFKSNKSSNAGLVTRVMIGGDGLSIQNTAATPRSRFFRASSTGVVFSDGINAGTTNNDYAIPYRIYGIKLGGG